MGTESKTWKTHRTVEQIQTSKVLLLNKAFISSKASPMFNINLLHVMKKMIRIHIKSLKRQGSRRERKRERERIKDNWLPIPLNK